MERYYTPGRFLTDIEGDTKEEILKNICTVISRQEKVDDDFYELVIERETFAQIDYGNYITLPHPNRIASEETFAYAVVLKQPIIWNKQPVQVILLISVGRNNDHHRQKFYEGTARFALDKEAVRRLIAEPVYDVLMELLK